MRLTARQCLWIPCNSAAVSAKAGGLITFAEDTVFYGVYVHDTTKEVELTFHADTSYGSSEGEGDLVGLKVFDDGSVERPTLICSAKRRAL